MTYENLQFDLSRSIKLIVQSSRHSLPTKRGRSEIRKLARDLDLSSLSKQDQIRFLLVAYLKEMK